MLWSCCRRRLPDQTGAALLAQPVAVATDGDDVAVVQQPVEDRSRNHRVAEDLWMPHRLTDESLRCGWLIRTILFMGSAFRSAVDARDAGRG
jgi:hypothetical protein